MDQRFGIWRYAHRDWRVKAVSVRRIAPQAVRIEVDAQLPAVDCRYGLTYTAFGSGDLLVAARFTPGAKRLPEMPRFGVQMALPGGLDTIAWFGRGPHETYCDRNDARIGPYSGPVDRQYFADYTEPGESGNKADVRWAALSGAKGVGLLAVGMPHLSVNALPYATDDLQGPKHTFEIPRRDFVTLNLDLKQMGVGGDNSWGAQPHPEYKIPPQPYSCQFRLRPFSTRDGSPPTLAKSRLPAME
jgi:beta-galactosidase